METNKLILKKVPGQRKNIIDEDVFYQIEDCHGFGSIGTLKIWKEMFPDKEIIIKENLK